MFSRFLTSAFAISIALSTSSLAIAADEKSGEKAFQSLAKLLVGGTWTRGADSGFRHKYTWAIDGQFVHRVAEGGPLSDVGIIGVDPETNLCTWWTFNEDGSVGKLKCTLESQGVWILEEHGKGSKGEHHYKGRASRVDGDTIKEEVLEWVINGNPQEKGTFEWKRK